MVIACTTDDSGTVGMSRTTETGITNHANRSISHTALSKQSRSVLIQNQWFRTPTGLNDANSPQFVGSCDSRRTRVIGRSRQLSAAQPLVICRGPRHVVADTSVDLADAISEMAHDRTPEAGLRIAQNGPRCAR